MSKLVMTEKNVHISRTKRYEIARRQMSVTTDIKMVVIAACDRYRIEKKRLDDLFLNEVIDDAWIENNLKRVLHGR